MSSWTPLATIVGIVLILIVSHDFLRTVLTVSGGGPVTGRINAAVWNGLLRLHERRRSHAVLAWAGPLLAMGALLFWATLLWLGWTLVFSGDARAVVDANSGTPAGLVERAYFVGYTLTTLGLGDFEPDATVWRIATVLAAANGLFLFTMAITYIVPIVGGTATLRQVANMIDGLGNDPVDIVARSWEDDTLESLTTHLNALSPLLNQAQQLYLAYPILHYFHSPDRDGSLPLKLAVLDEAVTLLAYGVEPSRRLPKQALMPLRGALDGFLGTLGTAWIEPSDDVPPPPDLAALAAAGVPVVSAAELGERLDERERHRRLLRGLLRSDGWAWDDQFETGRGHE